MRHGEGHDPCGRCARTRQLDGEVADLEARCGEGLEVHKLLHDEELVLAPSEVPVPDGGPVARLAELAGQDREGPSPPIASVLSARVPHSARKRVLVRSMAG